MTESAPSRPRLALLWRPREDAWLVALRVLLGALITTAASRTLAYGWVERFFVAPEYMFPYAGFEWLGRPDSVTAHALFVALAISGVCVSLGAAYRLAAALSFLIFTYFELLDVTNYLNHYYLLSLLTLLLGALPAHRTLSVDARLSARVRALPHYAWHHYLIRAQVSLVYLWAGLAKLNADWLLGAQPLQIWLRARHETPLLGALVAHPWAPWAMSWAGFVFDSTIWALLLWPRTRRAAFALALCFHVSTGLLFHIGMFPLIMSSAATCFFAPDWPRRLARAPELIRRAAPRAPGVAQRVALLAAGVYLAAQALFPARHWFYKGDVLWNERGMRWAWKVMVREKNGAITYRVRWRGRERDLEVAPGRYLTDHQAREMSGQPDMIVELGRVIGREHRRRGRRGVEVRVDAWVSLNGRPPRRLIDPEIDLMQIDPSPFAPAPWITEAPDEPPADLSPPRSRRPLP